MTVLQNDIRNSGSLDFDVYPILEVERALEMANGQNQKGLLVVSQAGHDASIIEFLTKILSAVQHDLGKDTLHLQITNHQRFCCVSLHSVANFEKIIIFGFPPAQIGLNIQAPLYHPTHFYQKTFLFADDLAAIQNNPNLKRNLWASLKVLFGKEK